MATLQYGRNRLLGFGWSTCLPVAKGRESNLATGVVFVDRHRGQRRGAHDLSFPLKGYTRRGRGRISEAEVALSAPGNAGRPVHESLKITAAQWEVFMKLIEQAAQAAVRRDPSIDR